MAKLGWIAFAAVGALLVGGAVIPRSDDGETKASIQHIERMLAADVHPRIYKHNPLPGFCDSDRVCATLEKSISFKGSKEEKEVWFLGEIEAIGGKELRAKFERHAADNKKAMEELKKKYPDLDK